MEKKKHKFGLKILALVSTALFCWSVYMMISMWPYENVSYVTDNESSYIIDEVHNEEKSESLMGVVTRSGYGVYFNDIEMVKKDDFERQQELGLYIEPEYEYTLYDSDSSCHYYRMKSDCTFWIVVWEEDGNPIAVEVPQDTFFDYISEDTLVFIDIIGNEIYSIREVALL